jgi:hypothetical protein
MLPPDLERASPRRVYRPAGRDRWYLVSVLLTAVAFSVGILWRRAEQRLGFPSHDIYAYFYPNFVYALQSLRSGSGLLWNPYQDCGQPFFAISQVGLLYPVNLVFLLLPREPALVTAIILNLTIAGAGIFLLCRQLELHLPAALGAAAVFQFGGAALQLASWSPIHLGAYVWLPAAMWATERLIAHPTRRAAVLLGVVLAIQILPGFPQITFFTYQLIALRVLWAVAVGPAPQRAALIAAAALGLALPVLLSAVQFVPSLEVARESMRTGRLPNNELGDPFTLHLGRRVLQDFTWRNGGVLIALAALPWMWTTADRRRRSDVGFYACAALLHFLLALGPGMPLFDLYALLPVTTTFRGVGRLLWVSNFAIAVLAGFGIEAVLRLDRGRSAIVACIVAGAVALQVLALGGIGAADWILAAGLVAATALAQHPPLAPALRIGVPLLVALRVLFFSGPPLFDLHPGNLYWGAANAFSGVRDRLTPQDRVLVVSSGLDPYPFTPKAGSLYRMPNIFDYEPQATRSYAEYFTYMRTGHPMQQLADWYWVFGSVIKPTLQRRLLDLTAARYLIVNPSMADRLPDFQPPLQRLDGKGEALVYENPQALARARYVPRVAVLAADEILPALAGGTVDPRDVALLSDAPRSGFVGAPSAGTQGTAEIVVDRPERVAVRVHASAPGFLFLADQFFPGWRVTVDGRESELLRANYTFRLVEVPAGDSTVEFRYRPRSIVVGALLSLAGVVLCAGLAYRRAAD